MEDGKKPSQCRYTNTTDEETGLTAQQPASVGYRGEECASEAQEGKPEVGASKPEVGNGKWGRANRKEFPSFTTGKFSSVSRETCM